jgi:hypothetical protein
VFICILIVSNNGGALAPPLGRETDPERSETGGQGWEVVEVGMGKHTTKVCSRPVNRVVT